MAEEQHVYNHPSRVERWRHLVEIVALSLAALWALYIFIYQERIKPGSEGPSVLPTLSVEHEPMLHGKEFIRVDLPVKDIGAADVSVVGGLINVYGLQYSSKEQTSNQQMYMETISSHALQPGKPVLLQSLLVRQQQLTGGLGEFHLTPGSTGNFRTDLAVPYEKYDAVRVEYYFCFGRSDSMRSTYAFAPKKQPTGAYDYTAFSALKSDGLTCRGDTDANFPL